MAHDSFYFDSEFKIIRQNIGWLAGSSLLLPSPAPTMMYAPASVQDAWDNHFSAFGAQNLDQIMRDYTDESVLVRMELSSSLLVVDLQRIF